MKTMGDTTSPNRRRKLATPQESFQWTVDKKDLFRTLLEKYSDHLNENEKLDAIHQTMLTHQGYSNLSLQEVRSMASLMVTMENVTKSNNSNSNNKTKTREIEEVTDEFAPDVPNDNSVAAPNDTNANNSENEKSDTNTTANSNGVCDKNHWVHLFSDKDVNVECILTEQLLQIRKSLKSSFKGCDIYKPKKPKGLATMVLDEWKRYYPDSEETNKTIGIFLYVKKDMRYFLKKSSNQIHKLVIFLPFGQNFFFLILGTTDWLIQKPPNFKKKNSAKKDLTSFLKIPHL